MLRPVLKPVAPVRDFQDWSAWREITAVTIDSVMRELPDRGPRLVIVPQTITAEVHWSQITASLDPDTTLLPVALHVTPEEHRRRVAGGTEEPDAQRWRLRRFERSQTLLPPAPVGRCVRSMARSRCAVVGIAPVGAVSSRATQASEPLPPGHGTNAEVLDRDAGHTVLRDAHNDVAELLGAGGGHGVIHPDAPRRHATSDVTYSRSRAIGLELTLT
ncbi:hypothetical protein [Brevibacterium sp.]|uniref:hypothetical protein n=1 Tax=Brevibacterium sp. TaxID=1701 RepID=UPI0025C52478|nr:hypothetical protein [Brevibacterium sp.]